MIQSISVHIRSDSGNSVQQNQEQSESLTCCEKTALLIRHLDQSPTCLISYMVCCGILTGAIAGGVAGYYIGGGSALNITRSTVVGLIGNTMLSLGVAGVTHCLAKKIRYHRIDEK